MPLLKNMPLERANQVLRHPIHQEGIGTLVRLITALRQRRGAEDYYQFQQDLLTALRRSIADTEAKIKRTVRNLELVDDPDRDLIRDINERRAELRAQKEQFESQLAEVEERILHAPNPDLIDALPVAKIQIDELSDDLARALFEALRLEIHYNKHTNQATCRITLTGQTITAARHAARTAVAPLRRQQGGDQQEQNNKDQGHVPTDDDPGPILVVPPARLVLHLHEPVPVVNCWFPPRLTLFGVTAAVRTVMRSERREGHHGVVTVAGRWAGLRRVWS
ncbi:hypothetical protein [Longimycelium tulufanense]|uniref:hypothetical protein n=1 Tax=Longimycelium tulufanense TaxID=907463 RepID=UPI00166E69BD|nr:hypothetical protein [Longimycelium tulufanense]